MKTIELSGTVNTKHEVQFGGGQHTTIGIEIDYGGGQVSLSSADQRYADVRVGDNVRVLVLDDAPPKLKKADMLSNVERLVEALQAGGIKDAKECVKKAEEGWSDKKIERRLQPQETICSAGGIYAPGTK